MKEINANKLIDELKKFEKHCRDNDNEDLAELANDAHQTILGLIMQIRHSDLFVKALVSFGNYSDEDISTIIMGVQAVMDGSNLGKTESKVIKH